MPKISDKTVSKTSNKTVTRTDKLIGRNVRIHRLAKGLTQEALGEKLGVTFQQIQKYEKGGNRVGSGRLYRIAEVLEVPVTTFFDGEAKVKVARTPSPFDYLSDLLTLRMAREFSKLGDRKTRRAVLAVLETLTGTV